ncbi:MAG: 3-isopropylmalate dehydrogenase [Cytophagia bacterium]|jgi:3-isopropylmalate dehydrogenase|nr:3-isopropylmalate dehydrogenase [Cytophagia bacterium]|tara:strand:- start:96 stop:1163 length:1068 start_codon:yes stop_codon:yes gene_type:complete
MIKKIAVLGGDGIGPEVMNEALKILDVISEKSNTSFSFSKSLVGSAAIDAEGHPFPDSTKKNCIDSDAILFGAIGDPKYDNNPKAKIRPEDGLLEMRKFLGLYANVRPVKTYESLLEASPLKRNIISGTDFVVYRELTGGIYFGDKGISDDRKSAFDTCSYTSKEIERISHLAFKEALKRKKRITLVDKANVLDTSRLWREIVQKISKKYNDVEVSYLFVDNAAMKIITNPKDFDIILTENMFGDIITDEASVITGSLGMLPSASVGDKVSLFEPIHGSYPEAAGKGIANPMAMILSLALMLDLSFNMKKESEIIIKSVEKALIDGYVTKDINNKKYYSTQEVGNWITDMVRNHF